MPDGGAAAWLRRLFEEWFRNAVSTIDFNAAAGAHTAKYLWAVAGARYGPGTKRVRCWAKARPVLGEEAVPQLKAGRVGKVLAALRRAGGGECGKAARCIAERRDRMRYDDE